MLLPIWHHCPIWIGSAKAKKACHPSLCRRFICMAAMMRHAVGAEYRNASGQCFRLRSSWHHPRLPRIIGRAYENASPAPYCRYWLRLGRAGHRCRKAGFAIFSPAITTRSLSPMTPMRLNGVTPSIYCFTAEGMAHRAYHARRFDLILANILATPLCHLAADFKHHLRPHGRVIVSGILNEQARRVSRAIAPMICRWNGKLSLGMDEPLL